MDDDKLVSKLIILVMTGRLSVREAILQFPQNSSNRNIKAAYHALIHYEADEDLRACDIEFRKEQDEYLVLIAELLQNGKDLPQNIINSYADYYSEIELPKYKIFKRFINFLRRFLNIK